MNYSRTNVTVEAKLIYVLASKIFDFDRTTLTREAFVADTELFEVTRFDVEVRLHDGCAEILQIHKREISLSQRGREGTSGIGRGVRGEKKAL